MPRRVLGIPATMVRHQEFHADEVDRFRHRNPEPPHCQDPRLEELRHAVLHVGHALESDASDEHRQREQPRRQRPRESPPAPPSRKAQSAKRRARRLRTLSPLRFALCASASEPRALRFAPCALRVGGEARHDAGDTSQEVERRQPFPHGDRLQGRQVDPRRERHRATMEPALQLVVEQQTGHARHRRRAEEGAAQEDPVPQSEEERAGAEERRGGHARDHREPRGAAARRRVGGSRQTPSLYSAHSSPWRRYETISSPRTTTTIHSTAVFPARSCAQSGTVAGPDW